MCAPNFNKILDGELVKKNAKEQVKQTCMYENQCNTNSSPLLSDLGREGRKFRNMSERERGLATFHHQMRMIGSETLSALEILKERK
jgi:predicted  nucleic acid-binding Zn ribbon protein